MQNVKFEMIEGNLHIVVDPAQEHGLTKSEKSLSVAKTGGWGQKIRIAGEEYTISLNVYKPLPVDVNQAAGTVELG